MFGAPIPGGRFFCGRVHRRPFWVVLADHWGWHQENYRIVGEIRVRRRWVRSKGPGKSIYTCRKIFNHWRLTVKPPGLRWVKVIHDTQGMDVPKGIKNPNTPYWKPKAAKVTRKEERIQVPTEAWELGHKYEFTRWQGSTDGIQ